MGMGVGKLSTPGGVSDKILCWLTGCVHQSRRRLVRSGEREDVTADMGEPTGDEGNFPFHGGRAEGPEVPVPDVR